MTFDDPGYGRGSLLLLQRAWKEVKEVDIVLWRNTDGGHVFWGGGQGGVIVGLMFFVVFIIGGVGDGGDFDDDGW